MKTLGEFLRGKRVGRKIGLREFARKINYDCGTISKFEHGTLEPGAGFLTKASRCLRLSQEETDELFSLAGRLPPDIERLALLHKGVFRLLRENVPEAASQSSSHIAMGTITGKE